MKFYCVLLVVLFLLQTPLYSQSENERVYLSGKLEREEDDTAKVEHLIASNRRTDPYTINDSLVLKILNISEKINFYYGIAWAFGEIAEEYRQNKKFDSCIKYCFLELKTLEEIDNRYYHQKTDSIRRLWLYKIDQLYDGVLNSYYTFGYYTYAMDIVKKRLEFFE